MSKDFPMVALGDLLMKSEEQAEIYPDEKYRQVTVKLWGKGVELRSEVDGASIAASRMFLVKTNQFILSKIDARNGAFGLVPAFLDGAVVSADFPVFTPNASRILPAFLHWMSKTASFVALCVAASEGTTNRIRLRIDRFLAAQIPLPPLDAQRRIVARIEQLASRIEEARGLRNEVEEKTEQLLIGEEFRIWPNEALENAVPLEEITTFLARGKQSAQGESNHYLIKTQHVQMKHYVRSRITLSEEVVNLVQPEAIVRPGDVLIACSAAGCLGRVAQFTETDQLASTDTHVAIARADSKKVLPEYLYAYLRGAQGQIQLRSRERGDWMREKVGFRLTELNLADLRRVPVPLPPLEEQHRIVAHLDALQARVDTLKRMQAESSAELEALLPSILDKAFRGEL